MEMQRWHSSSGKEQRLLEYVLQTTKPGNPQLVLQAIDGFKQHQEFLMNLGDEKSKILIDAVDSLPSQPRAVLELGTYCGYSAILLASELRDPTARVYTLDICEANVAVARQLIAHAGLSGRIVHLVKPLERSVEELATDLKCHGLSGFDLVFIDHDKTFYLSDLQLLVRSGLLRHGTVVVADNLLIPGAPDYRDWMSQSDDFEYVEHTVELSPGMNGHSRGPSGREAKKDIVGVGIYEPNRVSV